MYPREFIIHVDIETNNLYFAILDEKVSECNFLNCNLQPANS